MGDRRGDGREINDDRGAVTVIIGDAVDSAEATGKETKKRGDAVATAEVSIQ